MALLHTTSFVHSFVFSKHWRLRWIQILSQECWGRGVNTPWHYVRTNSQAHSHLEIVSHSYVFGRSKLTREPEENPRGHLENMLNSSHRLTWAPDLNGDPGAVTHPQCLLHHCASSLSFLQMNNNNSNNSSKYYWIVISTIMLLKTSINKTMNSSYMLLTPENLWIPFWAHHTTHNTVLGRIIYMCLGLYLYHIEVQIRNELETYVIDVFIHQYLFITCWLHYSFIIGQYDVRSSVISHQYTLIL